MTPEEVETIQSPEDLGKAERRLKWLEEKLAYHNSAFPITALPDDFVIKACRESNLLKHRISAYIKEQLPVRNFLNISEDDDPTNVTVDLPIYKTYQMDNEAFWCKINDTLRRIRSVRWRNSYGWFALTTEPVKYMAVGTGLLAIITINVLDQTLDE